MRALLASMTLLLAACRTAAPPVALPPGAAAVEAAPAPPPLRLPGDVVPRSYQLELTVVPTEASLTGRVAVDAAVLRPTRVVWLNATDVEVSRATLGGRPAAVLPGGEDFVGLLAEAPLPVGPLAIELQFKAGIDHQKSRGVYAEKEGPEAFAYTFFEPIDARRAFPCFDEPAYKVPWTLTLHVKAEQVAAANTAVVSETPEPGGMKKVVFAATPPLPSYLVAFLVGPFDVVEAGAPSGVPLRFLLPPGRRAELGWALESTPRVVTALVDWFGMGYPFGKLDVAVVPRFWGTMEHPGLVAMGQPLTLIRPEQATRSRKLAYTDILAHELAHYWFGDLVTTAWWDDVWLNEALGQWMDAVIVGQVHPEWRLPEERVVETGWAMTTDELLSTQPIRLPVETREAIAASFDGEVTYTKGAAVLRMFEAQVGPARWQGFIRSYLAAHRWGNATADDFLRAMGAELGEPLAAGFRSFLTQPGLPRVEGTLECGAGGRALVLSQRRSLPEGVAEPGEAAAWGLPVCVRYGDGATSHRACVQLPRSAGATTRLPLETARCPGWVLLNAGASGYHRSAVEPRMVRELLTPGSPAARQAGLTVAERLMLVADVRGAAARGELDAAAMLGLAPLVAADPDERVAEQAPALAAVRAEELGERWYQAAQRFRVRTFGPLARRLGWRRGPQDSDDRQALRQGMVAWVARAGDEALAAEGAKLGRAWLEDPATAGLADDLVDGALALAARRGDQALYERVLAAARAAPDRRARGRLLGALAHFTAPPLVERTLGLMTGTEFDSRETAWLVAVELRQRETRTQAWGWLQAHVDQVLAARRSDEASGLLESVASVFCDPAHRAEVAALLTPRAEKIDGAQRSVARGLEETDRCIARLARDRPAPERFLAAVR